MGKRLRHGHTRARDGHRFARSRLGFAEPRRGSGKRADPELSDPGAVEAARGHRIGAGSAELDRRSLYTAAPPRSRASLLCELAAETNSCAIRAMAQRRGACLVSALAAVPKVECRSG